MVRLDPWSRNGQTEGGRTNKTLTRGFLRHRYGPDGNWSAFEFTIGVRTDTAQQRVDLQISTALSEVWIIDDGGCLPSKSDRHLVLVDRLANKGFTFSGQPVQILKRGCRQGRGFYRVETNRAFPAGLGISRSGRKWRLRPGPCCC